MHRTIFDTPVINALMRWLSRLVFRLLGWQIEGGAPAAEKCVLIAAPHTSNWDFPQKVAGTDHLLHPTRDLAADLLEIQRFYVGITGKNP